MIMKVFRTHQCIIFLLIISLFFSCQREVGFDKIITTPPVPVQPTPVQASLQGKVTDENNLPVAGASVKSGSNTTTTDIRGLFFFRSIPFDKYSSLVTVEKTGYFKALRNFSIKEGASGFVKLKIIPKRLIGTIDAATGGSVTLPNNSIITIAANSIVVKSNNQNYTASIKVYAAIIDPASADIGQTVPGSFAAIDSQNRRTILKSYGMVAVELEGQSNEPLQIGAGKTAKLRVTIPSSLQASAPANIPMWYIDETTGLWKQEGNGTKTNNYYEGNVSHFSFWNYDWGFLGVFIEFILKNPQGIPLPYTGVRITGVNSGAVSYGYTDSVGYACGFVINNEPLRLEVLNTCNDVIYTRNIGQLSQNTNLGTITVTLPVQNSIQITGSVVDCNHQPVAHGTALIYFEGQLYGRPVINGNFSLGITQCPGSSNVEIIVVDSTANQQSASYSFTLSGSVLNTGTLDACGISTISFINYTYDNTTINLSTAVGDTLAGFAYVPNGTGFPGIGGNSASQPGNFIGIEYDGPLSPGTYTIANFDIGQAAASTLTIYSTPFNITITSYGAVGQFIEGTINARIITNPGMVPHTITGNFRVKRLI
jgi:hypothetical protein